MVCVHELSKETVPEELCGGLEDIARVEKCQVQECLQWKTGAWSEVGGVANGVE